MGRTARTSGDPPLINVKRHVVGLSTHLIEVWDFGDVNQVDDSKVLHFLCNAVQRLVHGHALRVPVVSEADHHSAVFLRFYSFIDMPARRKVGQKIRHVIDLDTDRQQQTVQVQRGGQGGQCLGLFGVLYPTSLVLTFGRRFTTETSLLFFRSTLPKCQHLRDQSCSWMSISAKPLPVD